MRRPPQSAGDAGPPRHDRCSLCADAGEVGEVVELLAGGEARVRLDSGEEARAALDLVGGVAAGDRLLVHQGFALARLGEPA